MSSSTSTPPPTSTTAINGDKLSGQLIIKAQLGDDIRKMMIHNEDLTLNELLLMMERVFAGKISNSDEITIKYLDEDGDKITLLNDSDLTVALHFHKFLRLFVFVNGTERLPTKSTDSLADEGQFVDAKTYRKELQDIRNSVQTILDKLQISTKEVSPPPPPTTTTTVAPNTTREFDPFKHAQQQQQPSASPDTTQSNAHHEHHTAPLTVDAGQGSSTNGNQMLSATFPQTQMPTPHFTPSGFNHDQQAKTNIFGPPPSTFPGMPPLPTNPTARFPPPTTSTSNTPPTFYSNPSAANQSSAFLPQQTSSSAQQSGFYDQQKALFQSGPPVASFNANPTFSLQQQQPPMNNPAFAQPPPPMASQQTYGGYPPPNSYYNPMQQYPKA